MSSTLNTVFTSDNRLRDPLRDVTGLKTLFLDVTNHSSFGGLGSASHSVTETVEFFGHRTTNKINQECVIGNDGQFIDAKDLADHFARKINNPGEVKNIHLNIPGVSDKFKSTFDLHLLTKNTFNQFRVSIFPDTQFQVGNIRTDLDDMRNDLEQNQDKLRPSDSKSYDAAIEALVQLERGAAEANEVRGNRKIPILRTDEDKQSYKLLYAYMKKNFNGYETPPVFCMSTEMPVSELAHDVDIGGSTGYDSQRGGKVAPAPPVELLPTNERSGEDIKQGAISFVSDLMVRVNDRQASAGLESTNKTALYTLLGEHKMAITEATVEKFSEQKLEYLKAILTPLENVLLGVKDKTSLYKNNTFKDGVSQAIAHSKTMLYSSDPNKTAQEIQDSDKGNSCYREHLKRLINTSLKTVGGAASKKLKTDLEAYIQRKQQGFVEKTNWTRVMMVGLGTLATGGLLAVGMLIAYPFREHKHEQNKIDAAQAVVDMLNGVPNTTISDVNRAALAEGELGKILQESGEVDLVSKLKEEIADENEKNWDSIPRRLGL